VSWDDARAAAQRRREAAANTPTNDERMEELNRQRTALSLPYRRQINVLVGGFIAAYRQDPRWDRVRWSMRQRRDKNQAVSGVSGGGGNKCHLWKFGGFIITVAHPSYLFVAPQVPRVTWQYDDLRCGCHRDHAGCLLFRSDGFTATDSLDKFQRAVDDVGASLVTHMEEIGLPVP
jgi:hypothetical protein